MICSNDNVVKEQRVTGLGGFMATLREVAKRAGVSIKTVSRIVNNDASVTAKTRASVQQHLNELRYVPNHAARQMRSGTSSVYGLMTDTVTTTPFSVDIVRGVQSALSQKHQTLIIATSDGDAQREKELWTMFRAHRVAGVIYAAMFHRAHDVGQPAFDRDIILANCFADGKDSIIPDDEGGGYAQARYLLERGHRNIGIVTLIPDIEATRLRANGMRRAFQEAGVVFDERMMRPGYRGPVGNEVSCVHEVAREFLTKTRPTAIICGNDTIAMQIYAVAASLGLSIPQDLSIIGFDDFKLISETLSPQLTTVALPYFEIGRRAVEMMNLPKSKASRVLVPCPLVERHSCRPLN
jgi:LacI family transcriptional regulator